MKKLFLLFLVLSPFFLLAQTDGGNNNRGNNTNPVVNPYDNNPYNPNQQNSQNFYDKKDQGKQNTEQKDNQNPPPVNKVNQNQFQDLNSSRRCWRSADVWVI